MKKYTVHYSFYLSEHIDVEASSEAEAKAIVDGMISNGEIGNLNEMEVVDSKIWVN